MNAAEFETLVEELLDGEGTPRADTVPFEELDPAQAEELRAHLSLVPALRDAMVGEEAFVNLVSAGQENDGFVDGVMGRWEHQGSRLSKRETMLTWAMPLAACLSAVLAWLLLFQGPELPPENRMMALLVDEAGATFAEGQGPDDVRFGSGLYTLQEGAMHLRFTNGADVIMRAPASFRIENELRLQLDSGGLRAIVPPSAHGFTVGSPGIDYEDLGTEFAVAVDSESGKSQLYVFEGEVNVREPQAGQLLSSVKLGQSIGFDGEDLATAPAPDLSQFPSPGSIGYERWKASVKTVRESSGLLAYYTFEPGEELVNLVESPVSHGDIQGARWVTGRWPGKGALLFDQDEDFVELDLQGPYEALSIALWLKLDRLDNELSAILDSNEWDLGDLHWQLRRHGSTWVGVMEWGGAQTRIAPEAPLGVWTHFVATISAETGVCRVWQNGQLVAERVCEPGQLLHPGVARLGNWLRDPDWPHAPVRALRGRIDELAIWQRQLSEPEIQELLEMGKPTRLWTLQNDS